MAEKDQIAVLEKQKFDLALLNQIWQELTSELNLEEIISRLLQFGAVLIGAEGSTLWLLDREQPGNLICRTASRRGNSMPIAGLILEPGEGIPGWVVRSGESVIVGDVSSDERFSEVLDEMIQHPTKCLLAVPLKVNDKIIGVLEVVNKQAGDFDAYDQMLAEALGVSAAIAIDNANKFIELQRLPHSDALTGLPTQSYFMMTAEREFQRAIRYQLRLTAVLMEINRLEEMDEALGREVDDYGLRILAQILSKNIRSSDVYGRFGEGKFAILLTDTNISGAQRLIARLRSQIESTPVQLDQTPVPFAVSLGVVEMSPDIGNFNTLVERIEEALQEAKKHTGGQIRFLDRSS